MKLGFGFMITIKEGFDKKHVGVYPRMTDEKLGYMANCIAEAFENK